MHGATVDNIKWVSEKYCDFTCAGDLVRGYSKHLRHILDKRRSKLRCLEVELSLVKKSCIWISSIEEMCDDLPRHFKFLLQ
jgi:hypothetical protein